MSRRKHIKQAEVRTLPNVIHRHQSNFLERIETFFGGKKQYTIELACGNGEYTIDLAKKYPTRCFIGLDRAGARIWNAARSAETNEVHNALFLLTYVEHLTEIFPAPCIEELWIPFPNPLPRRRRMKGMLVHPRYLKIYRKFLLPDAKIHLKTDDDILYKYAFDVACVNELKIHIASENLYADASIDSTKMIQTRFEKHHLSQGRTIKYLCFALPNYGSDHIININPEIQAE